MTPPNKKCCKKCETNDAYKAMCMIISCECHEELGYVGSPRGGGPDFKGIPKTTDSEVEWEKEFDKKFVNRLPSLQSDVTVEEWKHRLVGSEKIVGLYYGPKEIKEFIRTTLSSYGKEQFERGVEVGENNGQTMVRYKQGFEAGKEAARRGAKQMIENLKVRHTIDRELYNNTGGGEMCANCGKQGYIDPTEECDPSEINAVLNSLLSPTDSKENV